MWCYARHEHNYFILFGDFILAHHGLSFSWHMYALNYICEIQTQTGILAN